MLNQSPLQVVQTQLDAVHLRSCGGAEAKNYRRDGGRLNAI